MPCMIELGAPNSMLHEKDRTDRSSYIASSCYRDSMELILVKEATKGRTGAHIYTHVN